MKYWRGYLVALILAVLSWALMQYAQAHSALLDVVYPYMTRILQTGLATWSSGVDFCVWQMVLLLFAAAVLAVAVLTVLMHWNPIQVFGWVLVPLSLVSMLSAALYGMNEHTGPIMEDLRLETVEYSVASLEEAAIYYADQAQALSGKVSRDNSGNVDFADLPTLAQQAGEGFTALTYEHKYPIFAGSTIPVKELGWSGKYTGEGVTGMTVALTGESAVNPQVPDVGMPFAICHEMSHRMSIARDSDANLAAVLACVASPYEEFQYSGYLMALRYCYNTLAAVDGGTGRAALMRVDSHLNTNMKKDLATYEAFFPKGMNPVDDATTTLMVSWHVGTVVIPRQEAQTPVEVFDPMDESDERLWDVLNPPTPTVAEATTP